MEAPLGITPARGHSLARVATESAPLSTGMSLTPGGTSFVSVAGSQQSASQLQLQQQSSLEPQLSLTQPQHQSDQPPQQQQQVLQVSAVQGRSDSTDSSVSSPSMASVLGAAGGTSSSSSRAVSLWPSIKEEACQAAPVQENEVVLLQQQQLLLVNTPGQDGSDSPPVELAAGQPAATNGPIAHTAGVPEASAAAAAAARLLRQPIPPVTMVFMLVEGAKVFGQRRKQLVKEVHAQLSEMLMLALKHVPGGYMCRMQVG